MKDELNAPSWLWVITAALIVAAIWLATYCMDLERAEIEACERGGGRFECRTDTLYFVAPDGKGAVGVTSHCECKGARP